MPKWCTTNQYWWSTATKHLKYVQFLPKWISWRFLFTSPFSYSDANTCKVHLIFFHVYKLYIFFIRNGMTNWLTSLVKMRCNVLLNTKSVVKLIYINILGRLSMAANLKVATKSFLMHVWKYGGTNIGKLQKKTLSILDLSKF